MMTARTVSRIMLPKNAIRNISQVQKDLKSKHACTYNTNKVFITQLVAT